jgi:DHA1 family tetracycline resistance protein-like MFS transporter
MGMIGAAFGLGFIVGPGLGGLLVHPDLGRLGYQLPIFAAAGLCLLAALGVHVLPQGKPSEGRSGRRAAPAVPRRGA